MHSKIEELLIDWEIAQHDGNPVSPETLCSESPELLSELKTRIQNLSKTSWLFDQENEQNNLGSPSSFGAVPTSIKIFDQIVSQNLLAPNQKQEFQRNFQPEDNEDPAIYSQRLIDEELITPFQRSILTNAKQGVLTLDRYVILDKIGEGGMGEVFRARHRSMGREVAIKILPQQLLSDSRRLRFAREIEAIAKLNHPNIVAAFDAHEVDGTCFLVMELVNGDDIEKLIHSNGPMSVELANQVVRQVANAIQNAHEIGIVHRDIKPSNIMLTHDGEAKIADLGLARFRDEAQSSASSTITNEKIPMGTVAFMSPEQALDAHNADRRSDIYSLGCTYYFLLTGKSPYDFANPIETIVAHRESSVAELLNKGTFSDHSKSILHRMLAKDPAERFQTMREVSDAFGQPSIGIQPSMKITFAGQSTKEKTESGRFDTVNMLTSVLMPIVAIGLIGIAWKYLAPSTSQTDEMVNQRTVAQWVLNEAGSVYANTNVGPMTMSGEPAAMVDGDIDIMELEIPSPTTDVPFDKIGRLKNLTSLSLYDTHLDEAAAIELVQFPSLTTLTLDFSSIDETAWKQVLNLKGLKHLNVYDSELSPLSITEIGKLTHLKSLTLNNVILDDTEFLKLGELKKLQSLQLSNTEVKTAPFKFAARNAIETLDLDGTMILDSDFEMLPECHTLVNLSLNGCEVGDKAAAYCAKHPKLRSLDLSNTKLTNNGLMDVVKNCQELESLRINNTRIDNEGLAKIATLSELTNLELGQLAIDDTGIECLAVMANLTHLSISRTNVTDDGFAKLAGLGLYTIEIVDCNISEEAIAQFLELSSSCEVLAYEIDESDILLDNNQQLEF